MSNSQIPLHYEIFGRDGKMTQPWAFWFNNFSENLPPPGSGYVVDGSATTYGTMTIYQGPDINKGSSPSLGDIYIATDTGKIYVENAGVWVTELPEFTGDIHKPVNSTVITLNTVNLSPGTWGSPDNYPVITVNEKGLVTNVTLEPSAASVVPGAPNYSVQYNNTGVFSGDSTFIYNPAAQTLQVRNLLVSNEISFANPVPTRTNLLPTQTGLAGEVLTTNGTDVYWETTGVVEIPFSYGDATPKLLFSAPANKIIFEVAIVIETAFDSASSLSVGDAGDTQSLFETTDILTTETGTYTTEPGTKYGMATNVNLSITAGASTQGSGLVRITYQK